MRVKQRLMVAGLVACGLVLSGCSSTPEVAPLPQVESKAQLQPILAELAQQQASLTERLASAELGWYAPDEVEDAQDALLDAEEQLQIIQADPSKMNESIGVFSRRSRYQACLDGFADADSALTKAEQIRQDSQRILAEAFANRQVLLSLQADQHYSKDYQRLERHLRRLVGYVADDQPEKAEKGAEALERLQQRLEINTVRLLYVAPQQATIEALVSDDIDDAAPVSFAVTQTRLVQLQDFVERSPRELKQVEQLAAKVAFEATHSRHIGTTVQQLEDADEPQIEAYLLNLENKVVQLASQLQLEPAQQLALTQQLQQLNQQMAARRKAQQPSEQQLAEQIDSKPQQSADELTVEVTPSTDQHQLKTVM